MGPDEDTEWETVARLRMPISVQGLTVLADALEVAYGKDLRMKSNGAWLDIIRRKTCAVAT